MTSKYSIAFLLTLVLSSSAMCQDPDTGMKPDGPDVGVEWIRSDSESFAVRDLLKLEEDAMDMVFDYEVYVARFRTEKRYRVLVPVKRHIRVQEGFTSYWDAADWVGEQLESGRPSLDYDSDDFIIESYEEEVVAGWTLIDTYETLSTAEMVADLLEGMGEITDIIAVSEW